MRPLQDVTLRRGPKLHACTVRYCTVHLAGMVCVGPAARHRGSATNEDRALRIRGAAMASPHKRGREGDRFAFCVPIRRNVQRSRTRLLCERLTDQQLEVIKQIRASGCGSRQPRNTHPCRRVRKNEHYACTYRGIVCIWPWESTRQSVHAHVHQDSCNGWQQPHDRRVKRGRHHQGARARVEPFARSPPTAGPVTAVLQHTLSCSATCAS